MKDQGRSQEALRQKAIKLYTEDWTVSDICSTLGCSKSWFYKWLNRYKTEGDTWFKDQSKAPHHIPHKLDPAMEHLIIQTRKDLVASPYAQYGPQAIYYTLARQGHTPPPIWTIARTLKRQGLVEPKNNRRYISTGKVYPYSYCLCHQMDFVGPRYLSCKTRYYFHSLIGCDTHWCQTSVVEQRRASSVCECLIRFWKVAGVPDFLQMDNALCFWGSLRNPKAVGRVIRLCLLHGVTPVFIPQSEPWRNGVVECFNDTMQKNLLREHHSSVEHLQTAAAHFDQVHNATHHYSSQNGMTPRQAFHKLRYPLQRLDESYSLPQGKLPLERGEIHLLRFIRSDRKFNVYGLSFTVPKKVVHEYVKGVILTNEHRLVIFQDTEFIMDFPFVLHP